MNPVGTLVQESAYGDDDAAVMLWLNKNKPPWVAYISFGSKLMMPYQMFL